MLQGFGWPHLLIILLVVIVLFGAKRLPDAARGVGKSLRIFKSEAKAMRDEGDKDKKDEDTSSTAAEPQQLPSSSNGSTAQASGQSTPASQEKQNDVQA